MITPHVVYNSLGEGDVNYHALFERHIPEADIETIHAATNKAWVLGDVRFRSKVESLIARQIQPKRRGRDRRSESFKKKVSINGA